MAPRSGSAAGYKDYDVPKASGMHDKAPTSHPKGPMPMEEDQLEQDLEGGEDDDTGGFDKVGAGEEELCKDQGRMSGLDSFTGSSGDRWVSHLQEDDASLYKPKSRLDRQHEGKIRIGGSAQHKLQAKIPRAVKERQKQKKARQDLHPNLIVDTLNALGGDGNGGEHVEATPFSATENLVGAPEEPHQEE